MNKNKKAKMISTIEASTYPSHMCGGPFASYKQVCTYACGKAYIEVYGDVSYIICTNDEIVDLVIGDPKHTFKIIKDLRKYYKRTKKINIDLRKRSFRLLSLLEKRRYLEIIRKEVWWWGGEEMINATIKLL